MDQSDFSSILEELERSRDNTTHFSEAWSQGRSAFGGLAAAFAVTAMRKLVSTDIPMRALMVSFIAPLPPGKVQVKAKIQRQGRNVTQLVGEVYSGDQICLQAMGVFGIDRPGLEVPAASAEPPPRDQGVNFTRYAKRQPAFLGYFDGYWTTPGMPFSGHAARDLSLWVKHQVELPQFPVEKLVAIADIPPPVILSHFDKPPVPSSSLTWALEFVQTPDKINSEWFHLQFITEAAANGYTQQSGKIFDEAGQLCALTRQCMVYFDSPRP